MPRTPEPSLPPALDPALLPALREGHPLIQCLTNVVTVNLVANAVLAIGGTPAMVDTPGEAGIFAGVASATLVNVGTIGAEQQRGMLEATDAAREAGTPWVLDPVAVGTLPVRTKLAQDLLERRPTVIRGNASEIRALAGDGGGGRGVDAADEVDAVAEVAADLARRSGAVVAVSGSVDLVTDGNRAVRVHAGHPLLTRITGAGCALGGVLAAFLATGQDPLAATVTAHAAYGVAAERAAADAAGPGSFAVGLLDALAAVQPADLAREGLTA